MRDHLLGPERSELIDVAERLLRGYRIVKLTVLDAEMAADERCQAWLDKVERMLDAEVKRGIRNLLTYGLHVWDPMTLTEEETDAKADPRQDAMG